MKSLRLTTPHLIVMVGVPGSGKSFFAEHFADTFSAPLVSWATIRQAITSQPTYTKEEDAQVAALSSLMLDQAFKTGATILYEANVQSLVSRQQLAKKAAAAGYETLFVWVQTDVSSAKTRSRKQNTMPQNAFERYQKSFTPLKPAEPHVVISGKHTYASQLKIVLRKLSAPRAEQAAQPARRDVLPGQRSIPIQ